MTTLGTGSSQLARAKGKLAESMDQGFVKLKASTVLWMRWLRTCSAGHTKAQLQAAAMLAPVAAGAWCARDGPHPHHPCFQTLCRKVGLRFAAACDVF